VVFLDKCLRHSTNVDKNSAAMGSVRAEMGSERAEMTGEPRKMTDAHSDTVSAIECSDSRQPVQMRANCDEGEMRNGE
jgi:hypothetical protein